MEQPDDPILFNSFLPTNIDGCDCLIELALDLRWAWNHDADEVWKQLDSELWDLTHNAWVILQTVSNDKIKDLLANEAFRNKINQLLASKKSEDKMPGWFGQNHPRSSLTCVAYFSMEFMLCEALPIYSGGLGNVAGDQLKTASDLNVPIVGIGLLYQRGYFRQLIDKYGSQEAFYPYNDAGQLPITPVRQTNGEWLRLKIELPGYDLWLRCWQVRVGRRKLYLLDSNDPANFPALRGIISELYGGSQEMRLRQELILGIGGWRLLQALNIHPEVCHLNEGHTAFVILERARSFMQKTEVPFKTALAITRAGNIFTTHTPVLAGFDHFPPSLIKQYLTGYAEQQLGITVDELLELGRQNPHDHNEDFNMAYLAIRGSGAVNGVSSLHGRVSRHLFAPLFPRWPVEEIPVSHITNGVHIPSWDSKEADELWTAACGKDRWLGSIESLEENIHAIPDATLWHFRLAAGRSLVHYVRKRYSRQLAASGFPHELVEEANHIFDPNALILGFARRFVSYKRPNLLLTDPERLLELLTNPERPVQLILSGKAHPADLEGQALIKQWSHFILDNEIARKYVVFLSDYDMQLTQRLVQGVDVWINTPRRPWEACGTSGMKILANGGLNFSELDGWWAEAYTPEVGWALGDGLEHGDDPVWDIAEAKAIYDSLEYEIIPEFYTRDENGIPTTWIKRVRESMAQLTPRFSSNRTVREYTEQRYLPAAENYLNRAADNGALGTYIVHWQQSLEQKWSQLTVSDLKIRNEDSQYRFEVKLYLGGLDSHNIQVELYAFIDKGHAERWEMHPTEPKTDETGRLQYTATVPETRSTSEFTVRVMPRYEGLAVPLEISNILWQK